MLQASKEILSTMQDLYLYTSVFLFINFSDSKLFPKVCDPQGLKQNSDNFSKNIHFHFQKAGKDVFLKINVGFFLVGVRHP